MQIELAVQYASRRAAPPRRALYRWVEAALADWRRRAVRVGVRIVNQTEGAALNRRYRGRPGPTNVLSFPFQAPARMRGAVLGDLVICAPVVNREARAKGVAPESHWAHMVVHGIMHLRGYDHQSPRQAAIMERKEAAVLKRLGFGDPYA